jgi:peroxiredoxin
MMKNNRFVLIFIVMSILTGSWLISAGSVPGFSLKGIDGSTYKLGDHIGKKIIVIDFWATWCKPCKKLLKKLDTIYRDYKDHIEVLAISTDDTSAMSKVESYTKGKRFSFTVLLDPDSAVTRIFNPPLKIPFTVIVDKNGDIVYSHYGYVPGQEKEIIKKLEKLIHERK